MKADQWVSIVLAAAILLHVAAWGSGFFTNKRLVFISIVNLATALSVIIYWVVRQFQIQQHIIEAREVAALVFELAVIGCSLYNLAANPFNGPIKTLPAIFFGLHLLALILFLVFMVTFKMTRLI